MKFIHFADFHLGMENYGKLDPATGLSSRLGDFLNSLDTLVDYAIDNTIDLVIFSGDAYKTREPTQTQQREFARRINRLATAGIPVFLLAGNHDMPNAAGRATATEIFDTLAIPRITVAGKPGVHTIETASGPVQVAALPWLRRSALLSREETKGLTLEDINRALQKTLNDIINRLVEQLDPSVPAVLAAHVWVSGAKVGSESMMSIGQEHTLLLSSVANPAFDYVALGHIHKRQVLAETKPPVIYAGSLERVDFGEEDDEKGFYVVDITPGETAEARSTSYEFHAVPARRFHTLAVTLTDDDLDPTATVLKAIADRQGDIEESIVRLAITLPSSLDGQLRDADIREALNSAAYLSITIERQRTARQRSGGTMSAGELSPLTALKTWLDVQDMPAERRQELLSHGEKLLEES